MDRLVVVGASLAGLRAVEAARKAGFDGTITLIGAEPHLPYDRPPLSKAFLESVEEPRVTQYRDEAKLRDELRIDLRLGTPASAVDTEARAVRVGEEAVRYDALVIATGAQARTLPGCARPLRTVDDARAIRAALVDARRVVVIGAGFIGSEVASSARARGLEVTVVEAAPTPLVRAVGALMGDRYAALHARGGADLRCGTGVSAIEDGRVVLADGTVLNADLVVAGVGAVPATDWLDGSAVRLADGVVCDETLCTGVPGVYAAGDVARWHNPLFDRSMRLEHWTSAAEQGAVAARNALDPDNATAYQTVPYFWSDAYGSRLQFVGVLGPDEVRVVEEDGTGFTAVYREGDRCVGALTLDRPRHIMKLRRLIGVRGSWSDAVALIA
ncbi:NAD(P)/FAD-dependent oxidoreductase [Amycolatopsis anabasis]|uniref:NAD(P)/FAD-dependent oxidoreductase n=1 Tax=Amycolatopsis anabasis TaxID=1840409 RepID=UPI00131D17AC|nr:FAD-dependent oxidoreductase [Amycolatopsis anabasis]